MKKVKLTYIIVLSMFLTVFQQFSYAQNYADKEYYLVDSLDLSKLSENDLVLIESSLKLYHNATNDTSKIYFLDPICEGMVNDDWTKYQFFQYDLINKALSNNAEDTHLYTALATAINNIGLIYHNRGNIPLAIEYWGKSLKIFQELESNHGVGSALNNLGVTHEGQGDVDKALEYYHESLKIQKEIQDNLGIAYCLNNIGLVYETKGEVEKALEYHFKSLKLFQKEEHKKGETLSLHNIGNAYSKKGDFSEALNYFKKSLIIRRDIGDQEGIANTLCNIGVIELKQGKVNKAISNGLESMALAQEIGYPEVIKKTTELLTNAYEKDGQGIKALVMYKLFITMRDSINNLESQKSVVQQQVKYSYEKQKAIDVVDHDKQLAIEQEGKEKQKVITIAISIGLVLVISFLIIVFKRLRVTKKQKLIIERQKNMVEEAHKDLTDSIIYAKRIQTAILPPIKLVNQHLPECFILYKPKNVVSGDFYWMEPTSNGVYFAAADCTGHGVPGAMVSVICNNGLNRSIREYGLTDPGEILDKTREIVISEFEKSEDDVKDGMDIALCSLKGNILQYSGAHNPLWIIRNGEIMEIKANKQPIGKFDNLLPYTTHTLELEKGDSVYVFSDGYSDQFGGEKGKKFKASQFKSLLISIQEHSMAKQHELLDKEFETWKGKIEQLDDVCVIGVRI